MVKESSSSPWLKLRADILGSIGKVLESDSPGERSLGICARGVTGRLAQQAQMLSRNVEIRNAYLSACSNHIHFFFIALCDVSDNLVPDLFSS